MEPLLALERATWQALHLAEPAGEALHEATVAARKAGRLTHAMAAAHQLSSLPAALSGAGRSGALCALSTFTTLCVKLLQLQERSAA